MIAGADIVRVTAETSGLLLSDLLGPSTRRSVARPRQRAAWLVRQLRPEYPLVYVARLIGRTDHATVLYAERRVEARLARGNLADVEGVRASLAHLGLGGDIDEAKATLQRHRGSLEGLLRTRRDLLAAELACVERQLADFLRGWR